MWGKWITEFPGAVTVCDRQGNIIEMNEASCRMFAKDGGSGLVGKNLLDCHPEHAGRKIEQMLEQPHTHCYTTEKNGLKKLVYQSPWFEEGEFKGLVEIVLELPQDMPHYQR